VFANLIGNAVKFTLPGGRITVTAVTRDNEIVYGVTDTGAGIARRTSRTCSTASGRRARPTGAARGWGW